MDPTCGGSGSDGGVFITGQNVAVHVPGPEILEHPCEINMEL